MTLIFPNFGSVEKGQTNIFFFRPNGKWSIGCFHTGSKGESVKRAGSKIITVFPMITWTSSWSVVRSHVKSYTRCALMCIDTLWSTMCVYALRFSCLVAQLLMIATDLLLPPAQSVNVMRKCPIFNLQDHSQTLVRGPDAKWKLSQKFFGTPL